MLHISCESEKTTFEPANDTEVPKLSGIDKIASSESEVLWGHHKERHSLLSRTFPLSNGSSQAESI